MPAFCLADFNNSSSPTITTCISHARLSVAAMVRREPSMAIIADNSREWFSPSTTVASIEATQVADCGDEESTAMKRCHLHGLSHRLGSWLPEGLGDAALDVPACFVTQSVCAAMLELLRTVGNSGGEEEVIAMKELRDRGKELSAEEFRKHSRHQYTRLVRLSSMSVFVLTYYRMYALTDTDAAARDTFIKQMKAEAGTKPHVVTQQILLLCCCLRTAPRLMKAFLQTEPTAWLWQHLCEPTEKRGDRPLQHISWLLQRDDDGRLRHLFTTIAMFNHDAKRRLLMDAPSITARQARTAMTNYRYIPLLEQQFVDSIWLPTPIHEVPDELVSMIVSLLFERTAPSDYVRLIHSPAQQQRRQQRASDSHRPSSKRVRTSPIGAWEAHGQDEDETLALDSDGGGESAVESDDDDGDEWAKLHALHCERLAKQNNQLAKLLLDKHLRASPLSDEEKQQYQMRLEQLTQQVEEEDAQLKQHWCLPDSQ